MNPAAQDNTEKNKITTGTVVIGLRCRDGIIIAADRRATLLLGSHKALYLDVNKIGEAYNDEEGSPRIIHGTAGLAMAATQGLPKFYETYLRRYERQVGKKLTELKSEEELKRFLEAYYNYWFEAGFPNLGLNYTIHSGVSVVAVRLPQGVYLHATYGHCGQIMTESEAISPPGFADRTPFFCVGSGSDYASAVLTTEDRLRLIKDSSFEEAEQVIAKAMYSAIRNDPYCGLGRGAIDSQDVLKNKIDLVRVHPKGVERRFIAYKDL